MWPDVEWWVFSAWLIAHLGDLDSRLLSYHSLSFHLSICYSSCYLIICCLSWLFCDASLNEVNTFLYLMLGPHVESPHMQTGSLSLKLTLCWHSKGSSTRICWIMCKRSHLKISNMKNICQGLEDFGAYNGVTGYIMFSWHVFTHSLSLFKCHSLSELSFSVKKLW